MPCERCKADCELVEAHIMNHSFDLCVECWQESQFALFQSTISLQDEVLGRIEAYEALITGGVDKVEDMIKESMYYERKAIQVAKEAWRWVSVGVAE